jgi:hypothetical protein
MPATIQKILKPSKYRAVDTSGDNNHGQIYSGRALEFDGVSDYLNAGSASSLDNIWINGATIAVWIYCEDNTPSSDMEIFYKGAGTGPSEGWSFHLQTNGKLRFTVDTTGATDGNFVTSEILEADTWYRVVVAYNLGSSVSSMSGEAADIYINGIKSTLTTSTALVADYDSDETRDLVLGVGTTNHNDRFFKGMMCDAQVWDTKWTQSDVTYDYLNPESLALNNGGTSLTESNLKLWYPMQDGHRGQQSYILDGANTGLGPDLLPVGQFNSDSGFTTVGTGWSISNGVASCDGTQSGSTDIQLEDNVNFVSPDENGPWKINFTLSNYSAGILRVGMGGYNFSSSITANGDYSILTTPTNTSSNNRLYLRGNADFIGSLSNITVHKVNDKHHATTVFKGDDLWNHADNDAGSDWVATGSSSESAIGGSTDGVRIQASPSSDTDIGSYLLLKKTDTDVLTEDLTVGRTYEVTYQGATDVEGNEPRMQVSAGSSYIGAAISANNLATNGDFQSALSTGWTENDVSGTDGVINRTTGEKHNGTHSVYLQTAADNDRVSIRNTLGSFTVGDKYLVTYWTKADSTNPGQLRHKVYRAGGGVVSEADSGVSGTTWTQVSFQFTVTHAESHTLEFLSPTGDSSINTAYVDDVVVTKFVERTGTFVATSETDNYLMSRDHLSAEMIDDSKNRDFSSSSDWSGLNLSGGAITEPSNTLQVITTIDNEIEGAELAVSEMTTAPVVGRRYKITATLTQTSGASTPNILFSYGGGATSAFAISGSGVIYTKVVTAVNSTGNLQIYNEASTSSTTFTIDNVSVTALEDIFIDDISLKEVGVASGWTDADQQLDIPQTALQSYNQLAWFGENDAEKISCGSDSSIDTIWAGGGTASAWFYAHDEGNGTYGRVIDKVDWYIMTSNVQVSNDKTCKLVFKHNCTGTDVNWRSDSAVIEFGKWYHVVVVWNSDSITNTPSMYLNGELVDASNTDGTPSGDLANEVTDNFTIGNTNAGTRTFNGCITEISLWNDLFTKAEVNELYNDGKALYAKDHSAWSLTNLKGYWQNNGLATWTDLGNYGNDGSVDASVTETLLLPAGVDASRDTQGFLMNRQKDTNSLNLARVNSDPESSPFVMVRTNPLYTGSVVTKASVSAWVKFLRLPQYTDKAHIFDSRIADGDASFMLWMDASNVLQFRFYSNNSGTFKYVSHDLDTDVGGVGYDASEEFVVDKWIHLTATFETLASDTNMHLYANAKLIAGGVNHYTDAWSLHAAGDSAVSIGANLTNSSTPAINDEYVGNYVIDDALIYRDKALSADEITRNYKAGKRSHK